jgi:Tfp pilus assembly protein PilN
MITTQEALARIAVAEFESRRLKKRSEERARQWRLAWVVARILLAIAAAVYVQVAHWPISGAQVCGLLFIYLSASAWAEHRSGESLRRLQAEVDRLKDEIQRESA